MNVKEESQRCGIRHFNRILLKNVPGNIPNGYKPAILLFLIINHLLFFRLTHLPSAGRRVYFHSGHALKYGLS
ncbi:hypothetical protein DYD83_11815 [Dickeya fangzhongdai]|nr:hypothetical protein DYD82_11815 [Dickeya fangzhongdai]QOH54403.1 hypothetical protein DYD83_11815 [Dickeya fangzhongdai]